MGKAIPDAIIDAMLSQAEGTHVHVCTAEPANFAAIAAITLAEKAISGSYVKANGDVSGRKNTLPAQTALNITADGTGSHIAVSDGTSTLFLVTTCTPQALTSGGTVDLSAFAHEIRDPT